MNKKLIKTSILIGASLSFFIAGCGPEFTNDLDNNAQVQANANEAQGAQDDGQEAPPSKEGGAPEGGCPTGGCGARGGEGCPTGNCEIAPNPDTHRAVQNPDQIKTEPTKVIRTGEKQIATDTVDYHTTHHVWQPEERHHTVNQHRHLLNRHFTKVVYHPTKRRINDVVPTNSSEDQVMPTEEVVAPTIDYGCAAPAPVVQAVVTPVVVPLYVRTYPVMY